MEEQKNNGPACGWFIFIGAIALIAWIVAVPGTGSNSGGRANTTVTLQAAPGSTQVQMFESLNDPDFRSTMLPDGTRCTRLSGPHVYRVANFAIDHYKLNCNGRVGYVDVLDIANVGR